MGHSAGAQITGLLVFDSKWLSKAIRESIRCVIALEGIFDIPALADSHPNFGPWFLDLAFPDVGTLRRDASPKPVSAHDRNLQYQIVYSLEDEYKMEAQTDSYMLKLMKAGIDACCNKDIKGSHDDILKDPCLLDFIEECLSDMKL